MTLGQSIRNYFLRPQTVFFISFIAAFCTAILLNSLTFFLNHDEILVTTIARQPVPELINTIQAEPHPPGFYLYLHLLQLSGMSPQLVKLIVILTSLALYATAIWFAHKQRLFDDFRLWYAAAILCSSFTFVNIISHAKQDALSVPIFFLLLLMVVNLLRKKRTNWKQYISLFIVQHLLLWIGYAAFAFGSLVILIFWASRVLQDRSVWKNALAYLCASLLVVGIYFSLFGFSQLANNSGRFHWAAYGENAFIPALSVHMSGFLPGTQSVDIVVMLFLILVGLSFSTAADQTTHRHYLKITTMCCAALLMLYYATSLLVQARYGIFLFAGFSILAGWGLQHRAFTPMVRAAVVLVLCSFAMLHAVLFELTDRSSNLRRVENIEAVLLAFPTENIGLIVDHSLNQHAFRLRYFPQEQRLVPLNPNIAPTAFLTSTITFDHLMLDAADYQSFTTDDLRQFLKSSSLTTFVYYANMSKRLTHFTDPDKQLLHTFLDHCDTQTVSLVSIHTQWVFTRCSF